MQLNPTCTEKGTQICYCSFPEYYESITRDVTKVGHIYLEATCTEPRKCKSCGKAKNAEVSNIDCSVDK